MGKPIRFMAAIVLTLLLAWGSTAMAFSDIEGDPAKDSILSLKEAGIVSGVGNDQFVPKATLTYAEGVELIVKAFKLSLDQFRFIKEPKASDYYTHVDDDAWYAHSFIVAHLNGLPVPQDVIPIDTMSREQFAHLLFSAVQTTGDYAFIEIFILIADEDRIEPEYRDSIQKLLIMKAAELDEKQQFRPDDPITRSEAASMLHRALEFVKQQKPVYENPHLNDPVEVSVESIHEEVNKVTLSWGEKPTSGYAIKIEAIEFRADQTAVVKYSLHVPDPDQMVLQVITYPTAVTYVPSSYDVIAEKIEARENPALHETQHFPAMAEKAG